MALFSVLSLFLACWGIKNVSASMFCAYVMLHVLFSEHYIHIDCNLKPGEKTPKFPYFAIDCFNFFLLNTPYRNFQQEQCGDSQYCYSASG